MNPQATAAATLLALAVAAQSNSAVITYQGVEYEASTVTGSSTEVLEILKQQPWWGDDSTATKALVIQAWDIFGPVIVDEYANPIGPLVAHTDTREFIYVFGCSSYEPVDETGCMPLGYAIPTDLDRPLTSRAVTTYLVATPIEPVETATVTGFFPPVDPPSIATNIARAGRTIPLKFYAETDDGPITDLVTAHLTVSGVTCDSISTAADSIDDYVEVNELLLENLGGGYYQYNWKTPKSFRDTCKAVILRLPDSYSTPTNPVATFNFSSR